LSRTTILFGGLIFVGSHAVGCGKLSGGSASSNPATDGRPRSIDETLGKTPSMLGLIANVKLGSSIDDARDAAPRLFDPNGEPQQAEGPEYPNLAFTLGFDESQKEVTSAVIYLPDSVTEADVIRAWGAPVTGTDTSSISTPYWYNPNKHLRVSLNKKELEFKPYQPLDEYLGTADKLGFEANGSLLGSSTAAIEKAFGRHYIAKDKMIDVTPPDYASSAYIHLTIEGDHVKSFDFGVGFRLVPAKKDDIVAAMKKHWGEPKTEDEKLAFKGANRTLEFDPSKTWSQELHVTVHP
jgi:hypothetical protein